MKKSNENTNIRLIFLFVYATICHTISVFLRRIVI